MPNPQGNPEITKYSFKQKHNWDEPCVEKMTLRLPSSMKAAIKEGKVKNWQEVARRAIAAEIDGENPQND